MFSFMPNLFNFNVYDISRGSKLLALFEAGQPYRIDPYTLDTLHEENIGLPHLKKGLPVFLPDVYKLSPEIHYKLFGGCMTAHPKIDPKLKRFISWVWRATPAKNGKTPLDTNVIMDIYEWDENWKIMNQVSHKLTGTSVNPHDFSITKNYYLFIENRVSGNVLPYILGLDTPAACVNIQNTEPMILNMVKRPHSNINSEDVIKISIKPGFTIHSVCAFENTEEYENSAKGILTGGGSMNTIELFTTGWDTESVASGNVKGGLLGSWEGSAPVFDNIPSTYLYRSVVDIKSGKLLSHAPVKGMESTIVEHPHINPKYEGQPIRYIYMSVGSQNGVSSPPLGYLRLDLHTGNKQIWYAPTHTFCEEVVIIPKSEICDDESSVWALATMFDAISEKSYVGIFDGENIQNGPVCRIWLNHFLPHSLHGCFVNQIF
jgi:all-trans-8'-apo-beta-carotenal 15,15'-oxygenase